MNLCIEFIGLMETYNNYICVTSLIRIAAVLLSFFDYLYSYKIKHNRKLIVLIGLLKRLGKRVMHKE